MLELDGASNFSTPAVMARESHSSRGLRRHSSGPSVRCIGKCDLRSVCGGDLGRNVRPHLWRHVQSLIRKIEQVIIGLAHAAVVYEDWRGPRRHIVRVGFAAAYVMSSRTSPGLSCSPASHGIHDGGCCRQC